MSDKDIHAIATTEGKINEQKQGALQFYETKILQASFLLFFLISMVKLFSFHKFSLTRDISSWSGIEWFHSLL